MALEPTPDDGGTEGTDTPPDSSTPPTDDPTVTPITPGTDPTTGSFDPGNYDAVGNFTFDSGIVVSSDSGTPDGRSYDNPTASSIASTDMTATSATTSTPFGGITGLGDNTINVDEPIITTMMTSGQNEHGASGTDTPVTRRDVGYGESTHCADCPIVDDPQVDHIISEFNFQGN